MRVHARLLVRFSCALAALVSILLVPLPVLAQAGLEITVLGEPDGAPIPDAKVELTNPAIGFTATVTTNSQGKARFPSLSTAGEYLLSVSAGEAFVERQSEPVVLRSNFASSFTVTLPSRQGFGESVGVVATERLAQINTVDAEVSATLTEEEIELLPVEGRDLTRALYRLPNVTQATGFYPEAPNVSINGANSLYANYMLDGLDNNENFLGGQKFAVPTGFSQDVTVLTNNYSTEFGRTGNGVINVTTKSGGNQYRGEAFYLARPGASLDASSPFAGRDLSGNAVKDGFQRNQVGFALGGPVRRDRTFFFVDGEATRDDKDNLLAVPQLGVNETVPGENQFYFFSGKLDQRWTESLWSSLRVNAGDVEIESQGGGLEGGVTYPSAGSAQDRNSLLAAVKTSYVGQALVSESNLQFGRFRWNYGRPLSGPGPQSVVLGADGLTVAVLGHPGFVFDDLEETWQLQQKVTLPRDNHTLRLGAELLSADFSLAGGGNENGNYLVQLTAAQQAALVARNLGASLDVEDIPSDVAVLDYNVELRPKEFGVRQDIYSVYAEDLISLSSRLNLTLGLRYDYDNLSKGGSDQADDDNLAPRVALNYQLDDKSALRAGAGVFYDKVLYAIYSDALQQNSTSAAFRSQIEQLIALGILPRDTDLGRIFFEGNLTASFDGTVPYLGGPTSEELQDQRETVFSNERRILNPEGYDNPVTEQYTLGYQRQLGRSTLFYVDLIHTRSFNLFRLRDLNAPSPYPIDPAHVVVRTQAEADATRPVALVPGGARNIVVTESAGEARYRAATLTLQQTGAANPWSYRLSYTWSQLENNTDDINFRAQDANDFGAEWGPSINDREHVVSGFVQYRPLPRLALSLAALLQSGQPINRIPDAQIYGTTDLNGDGRSFGDAYVGNSDRSPGESRNNDRLGWSEVFDLGVQYRIPVRGMDLEARVDVLNLFNEVNLSGYSNNATQSNQIQVGPEGSGIVQRNAGPPRQFQLGLRLRF